MSSLYSAKRDDKPFAYFLGVGASVEARSAKRAIPEIHLDQDITLPISVRPNFVLGRHFYPINFLRIELMGEYSFSKAENDSNADFLTLKTYKAGGLDLNIHLVKTFDNSTGLFAGVGGGCLITSVKAEEDEYGYGAFKIRNFAPVLNLDLGCDVTSGSKVGVSIGYRYRFWSPTHFTDERDLPLQGSDYQEFVNSHGVIIKILLGRK